MGQPQVIICERSGVWAAALARHLPRAVRLVQTRALAECTAALAVAPMSLVALETSAGNLNGVLTWLIQLPALFPLARAVVLADHGLQSHEWLLREAGAVHFATSPRELDGLAPLVRNHLAQFTVAKTSFAEQVWDSLPWSEAATT